MAKKGRGRKRRGKIKCGEEKEQRKEAEVMKGRRMGSSRRRSRGRRRRKMWSRKCRGERRG